MARLPRLVIPGQAHCLILRGHSGRPAFVDDADRTAFLAALREAAATNRVLLHAYALLDAEVQLLAVPPAAPSLSRMVQAIGRRYVSAHNSRHGRSGTLWDGRFRCAVVEPGAWLLATLQLVDSQGGWTSAAQRTGGARDAAVVDPTEWWQLGNTPFEREAEYRTRLVQGLATADADFIRAAALGGWVIGSPSFIARLGLETARPLRPRARGRPALRR